MRELARSMAVYISAFFIGHYLADQFDLPQFVVGWFCCGGAIFARLIGPRWIRSRAFQ